jgi:hypothetical protein
MAADAVRIAKIKADNMILLAAVFTSVLPENRAISYKSLRSGLTMQPGCQMMSVPDVFPGKTA